MNSLQMLLAQPWVERLGMTLLHFLWQGLCIAVLYAAARRILARSSSPQTRYLLGCGALAAMIAAPVVTWVLMRPPVGSPAASVVSRALPQAASTGGIATIVTLPDSVRATVSAVRPGQFLSWVVVVWLAGAIVFWGRLAGGWIIAARMRSMLVRRAPPEWQANLKELGVRIGVSRPVRLLVSALVHTPTVIGWLRPVVLIPVGAFSGLPAEHVEALLLHELAHIRRHDYLINLLQSVVECLLFYHPAVWWISGHIRAERELCCDDLAVSISGNALTYARALAQLESYRPAGFTPALAASGGALANRIGRLLGYSRPAAPTGLGPGLLALAVLLVGAAYGLLGQTAGHPAFEVASIKPHPTEGGDPTHGPMGGGYEPGGRMHLLNLPLTSLIAFAYADHDAPHWLPLRFSQIVGGPAWARTDGYDIEAKPATNTDPKNAWLMLRTLLADRFKLVLTRETRELPAYDLKPAKGGLKLPPPTEAGCISFPPGTPPHHVPGKVDCGYVSGPFGRGGALQHIQGRRVHMADLVRELSSILDRPVVDDTGFTGEFDLDLGFARDEALVGMPAPAAGSPMPPASPDTPNIFAALEEQLGLKLVSAKAPVEVLVIDRAERPTAN